MIVDVSCSSDCGSQRNNRRSQWNDLREKRSVDDVEQSVYGVDDVVGGMCGDGTADPVDRRDV